MQIQLLALAAAGLFCSAVAPAAVPPATPGKLPAAIAAELKSATDQCREAGGRPLTGDAVRRADLNADGHEDFVLDVGAINCDGAAGVYGDREKSVSVYAGDGTGGASAAFNAWVFGARIEGEGPAATLWLTVAGELCGKKPAPDFASENFCDRALAWDGKARRFDYAPVSTARMIQ